MKMMTTFNWVPNNERNLGPDAAEFEPIGSTKRRGINAKQALWLTFAWLQEQRKPTKAPEKQRVLTERQRERYTRYLKTQKDAKEWMEETATRMYFTLPREMAGKIIGAMVMKKFGSTPQYWSDWDEHHRAAEELLSPFTQIAYHKRAAYGKDDTYFSDLVNSTATEYTLPNIIYHIDNARFPIKQTPTTLPYPRYIEEHRTHLLHLTLTFFIHSTPGADYYPIELYRL